MDVQTHSYDRSRPTYPRTASRSSTSTTNTRATSQSAGSSTSQVDPAQMATHRFHASCKSISTPRTTPRATPKLSREPSSESTRHATAISSLLQERLQTQRQAEHEKAAMSRSIDLSASIDLGRISHGSPVKGGDMRRPQSTTGSEKKKGLGVKDMDAVISSLHKQNFDLKLELYHRRERQTSLEEQVEKLELETAQTEEINGELMREIEKRDKAVEEAVAMIVMLEAKLEQFVQERGMVHQIECEGLYSAPEYEEAYEHPAPKPQVADLSKLEDDAKVLTRMPSFLSDRSETTENLRNVYLGVRGSVLSLPQVPEVAAYMESSPAPQNVLASPSLSVLSESSFVSVYGQKGRQEPLEVDEPLSLDGPDVLPAKANMINRPKTSLARQPAVSSRSVRSNSLSNTPNLRKDYHVISDIIDQGSPLQQIERLDPAYSIRKADSRPQSRDQDAAAFPGRGGLVSPRSPNHRRAREEKRASLRRVLTDAPGGVRLNDLPPTPDTISTSTLRRYRNSNDTLPQQAVHGQRSFGNLSDASGDEREHEGVSLLEASAKPLEHARELNNHAYSEAQARARAIRRPRSADETTISHRRANGWDSDDDDSDTQSLQSSLDIWMRESNKPDNTGRQSPDLFSFPANGKTPWNAEAMFGAKGIDPEQLLAMFPVQPEMFSVSLPPPPPNRRSSLLAQTGANPSPRPATKSGAPKTGRRTRGRRNSDDFQMRAAMQTPVQPPQPAPTQPAEQKKNYPPIVGHQPAQNALTKLFRRSISRASPTPVTSEPPTPEVAPELKPNSNMGIPSWVNRTSAVEEDFQSATPPPIMRNPRHSRHISADLGVMVGGAVPVDPNVPGTPTMPAHAVDSVTPEQSQGSPRVASATGVRRKWLPAFRAASFKTRAA